MPSRPIKDKGTQGSSIKVMGGSTERVQGVHNGAPIGLQSRLMRALMLSHPIAKLHEQRWLRGDGVWPMFGFNDRYDTRWKVCAIPLGGYVKFFGDDNAASVPDHAAAAPMSEAEQRTFAEVVGDLVRRAREFAEEQPEAIPTGH